MKRTLPSFFMFLFALLIMGWSSDTYAQYSGGDGSSGDPYQIQFFDDLQYLSENPGDWGYNFIQTADIDTTTAYYLSLNSGDGFSPIGNSTTPFSGSYDGQGHTISNLYINRPLEDIVGLFGYTDYLVIIKNLRLLDVDITGQNNVGAVGGAVYQADNCSSTGTITGGMTIGGLAGLVGFSSNSYSACAVNGTDQVGGFAGYNLGAIMNCYSTGSVTGSAKVGGFLGFNDAAVLQFCYSTGSVAGSFFVGGLVGYNGGGSSDDCFWDMDASGQATSAGGMGRVTAEMKRVGTYLADPGLFSPWDFTLAGNIWGFNGSDNNGYPFLRLEGHIPGNIWLGTTNQNWGESTNWSEGALPATADKVFIPGVLNDPILGTLANMTDMTIEVGGFLNVASTGQLTVSGILKNDAGNTGLVLDPDASLLNGTASVPGTVKREIAKDGKWHFLSCPIKQTPMPEICDGYFAPLTTDFNPTTNPTYDFFYWREPPETSNLNWINLKKPDGSPNTNTTYNFGNPPRFVTGKGYLVEYSSSFAGDAMKSFAGKLGAGAYTLPVTNTSGGNWSGYNLIGNVYPCSIDWKAASGWDRTVLENYSGGGGGGGKAFWIWNDATGNYGVYDDGLSGDGGTNGVSRYIPPTQSFFVKAATSGGIIVNDQARCHSTQNWLKNESNTLRAGVTSSVTSYSDEVLLAFNCAETGGVEKLFSFYEEAPGLYLPLDNNNYSIRFLNEAGSNPAIPLCFKSGKDGNYTITISGTADFSNVYLQDLKTGTMQDVKATPAYNFAALKADDANRFMIRFKPLGIDARHAEQNIFVYDNVLNVNNPGNAVITVYNMTGSKMVEKQTNDESIFRLPLQLPTGYYVVNVTNGKSNWSEKVFVK